MVFRVLQIPNISEKITFHLPTGGLVCSDGGYSPLALSWRHPWWDLKRRYVIYYRNNRTRMWALLLVDDGDEADMRK